MLGMASWTSASSPQVFSIIEVIIWICSGVDPSGNESERLKQGVVLTSTSAETRSG